MPRILVVDHQEMVRVGLRSVLGRNPVNEVVGEAADARQAADFVAAHDVDIVIMELVPPALHALQATRRILAHDRDIRIILTSTDTDAHTVSAAMKAGARAFILQSGGAPELQRALESALNDTTYLSPQLAPLALTASPSARAHRPSRPAIAATLTAKQREVLQLLAEGLSNKEVAAELSVTCKTVEAHRARIMEKLQIHNLAGLTKYAIREGLTSLEVG